MIPGLILALPPSGNLGVWLFIAGTLIATMSWQSVRQAPRLYRERADALPGVLAWAGLGLGAALALGGAAVLAWAALSPAPVPCGT